MNSASVTSPILSVIIPVFNAKKTLPRTLQSLRRFSPESRRQVEVVVVNDGSTDASGSIIADAASDQSDISWRVLTQANAGLSAARNAALAAASGSWVFFLDADDELATDLVPLLCRHSTATSIGCTVEYRLSSGRLWRRVRPAAAHAGNWLNVLTAENPYQPSSLIFRRACLEQAFDPQIEIVNDWMLWLANPKLFADMRAVPEVTSAVIHIHGNNMSAAYARSGRNRVLVAERVQEIYGRRLTRRQRNHLAIQRCIGKLQSGERGTLSAFTCVPCSPVLYLKLMVYYLSSVLGIRATPYQTWNRTAK